jgi:hypothetical protein
MPAMQSYISRLPDTSQTIETDLWRHNAVELLLPLLVGKTKGSHTLLNSTIVPRVINLALHGEIRRSSLIYNSQL